jgi:hypothetical protein
MHKVSIQHMTEDGHGVEVIVPFDRLEHMRPVITREVRKLASLVHFDVGDKLTIMYLGEVN